MLGLNAAHPLYGELRTLLCSMAKLKPSAKTPLSAPVPRFSVEALFTGRVIASVLLALETAVHVEIDPSSVFRLYPQHDKARISQLLGEWWEQGLVSGHHFGNIVLYRFDPDYPHYKPLRAFLRKIVECEPRYAAIAKLEPALYVSSRQRTAHARRRKETAQGQ